MNTLFFIKYNLTALITVKQKKTFSCFIFFRCVCLIENIGINGVLNGHNIFVKR